MAEPTAIRGRYKVIEEIASSPESVVLLAEDLRQSGRRCALKLLRLRGGKAFEAARREFEILRKLRHPAVAESYDFGKLEPGDPLLEEIERHRTGGSPPLDAGEDESLAYVASVYVKGLDLREAFALLFPENAAADGRPRDGKRWRLFLEALARICDALDVVHARGIVHHDLKPENLLLIPLPDEVSPSRFDVRILDFGLSLEESTPLGTRVRGTVPYIAPELFEGAHADRRSDLFSLGVSIAAAISGRPPFPGKTTRNCLAAARAGRRISLKKVCSTLPEGLAELVDRLIEPEPARRPSSALEVLERLEEIGGFVLPEKRVHAARTFPALGWQRELAMVRSEVSDLKRGEARQSLILLEGESGHFLGRLLDEVEAVCRVEGVTVSRATAALPRRHPFAPFAEIVRKLSLDIDLASPRFARYRSTILAFSGLRPEELGLVAGTGDGALPPLRPKLETYRFLDLATEIFLDAARESPLVLCIQDLHLAGREGIDLLRSIARNVEIGGRHRDSEDVEPPRLLIVGTVRDAEADREADPEVHGALEGLYELIDAPWTSRIRVSNLGLEDLNAWLRDRAPRLHLDGDLIRRLHERSGGNMWLADEFVRRIIDFEETAGTSPGAALRIGTKAGAGSTPEILLRLPWKAEDSAIERFQALPRRERRLLELLAAARGPLTYAEAAGAENFEGEGNPGGQPPASREEVVQALTRLESLGFVEVREGARGPQAALAHEPLIEQIYRHVREDSRASLHRALAGALRTSMAAEGPGRIPEDIAFHARHGGLHDLYIESALAAAKGLETAHAHEGALRIYEEVLERLGTVTPSSSFLREEPPAVGLDVEITRRMVNERLAAIHSGRGQSQKAIEKLTLLSTAHEVGRGPLELSSVYRRMGEAYHQHGEMANALYYLERSLGMLRDARSEGTAVRSFISEEMLLTLLALARHHLAREGGLEEARKKLDQAVEIAEDSTHHREALARTLLLLAEAEVRLGKHGAALAWNSRVLAAAERDLPLTFEVLSSSGSVHLAMGEYEKAIECFARALETARTFESKYDMASACSNLGTVYHNRADHQKALEYFERSLDLSSRIGDLKGIGTGYNNIGIVHRLKDELDLAGDAFKKAIDLFSRINDQVGMASAMTNLSSILEQEGKYTDALDYAFRALEKRKKSGSRSGAAFSYYRIGKILQSKGEIDKAISYAERSLHIRLELSDRLGTAHARRLLSELHTSQARYGEAFALCRKSLDDFEGLGNAVGVLMTRETMGRLLFVMNEVEEARKVLEETLESSRKAGQLQLIGNCHLDLGRLLAEVGDHEGAREHLEEAERLFRERRNRRELAETLLERCALMLDMGYAEEASRPLEEAYIILEDLDAKDLVPAYFLLRSRVEMEKPQPDIYGAGKSLERGLVQARALNLPELRWRYQRRLGLLMTRRGDPKLARVHFEEARDVLEGILDGVPDGLRSSFKRQRERASVLEAARAGGEPPPEPIEKEPAEPPGARPGTQETGAEMLALHRQTLKLHEIASVIGSETDLKTLLERIMDAALEIVKAERGFVILKGADASDSRTITAARNLDREMIEDPEEKISETVSREVMQTGEAIILRNAIEEPRFLTSESIRALRLRSVICVPLRFRNQVLGAIYLDHRHRMNAFRQREMDVLQAIADQAAVAVSNARLVEENARRQADLVEANRKLDFLNIKLRRKVHRKDAELAIAREDLKERQQQLEDRYSFRNIVGESAGMQEIFRLLEKLNSTRLPVLLEGESGTGKELLARAIHYSGSEKLGRFVSENCGAISEPLLESELFGHTRGAFTGAIADKKGLFELADGGTLFLDEVGDMSLGMQQKLLRVLQEGEIRRVGGKDSIPVRVRIISASNKDLRAMAAEGTFRKDLYFRLNGIRIRMPTLRERKEDIPFLVRRFVEEAAARSGGRPRHFDVEAIRVLHAHEWPGNVRELRHFVERTLLTATGDTIRKDDLIFDWQDAGKLDRPGGAKAASEGSRPGGGFWKQYGSLREARDGMEREFLLRSLRECRGNVTAAARRSRLSRESFYRLLRKHDIQWEERRNRGEVAPENRSSSQVATPPDEA